LGTAELAVLREFPSEIDRLHLLEDKASIYKLRMLPSRIDDLRSSLMHFVANTDKTNKNYDTDRASMLKDWEESFKEVERMCGIQE